LINTIMGKASAHKASSKISAKAKGKMPAVLPAPRKGGRPRGQRKSIAEVEKEVPLATQEFSEPGPSTTITTGTSSVPVPYGRVTPAMQAISEYSPVFLYWQAVQQGQVGPTDLTMSGPPASSPNEPTSAATLPTSTIQQEDLRIQKVRKYQELLAVLKLKKGIHAGDYKCHHCKVNKKALPQEPQPEDPWMCVCGCGKDKAVVEQYLVEKGILDWKDGPDGEIEKDDKLLYRSITKEEWSRLDHIMAALFGYNTSWLLDPALMKAGLLEAANRL
jgi:hypothetical protein